MRVPLTWAGAVAAIVAIVVALALLFTDRFDEGAPSTYGAARSDFDRVVAPVAGVVAAPVRWVTQGVGFVGGYFFAVSENRRLRERVAELERWRDAAIALKNINTRYENLLKLRTEPPIPMVAARVVSDARGPFSNARLADAGSDKGVKTGNPVISEHGVVGRVVGVAKTVSRVLLLTDVESRTPVLIDRTNARAILTGDGGPVPRLEFVRGRDPVKEGDRILTSGDGGLYPRGLPVGVAVKDFRGGWRVRLYTDQSGIDFVRILVFDDFSQMVDQAALENAPLPSLSPKEKAEIEAAVAGKPLPAPAPTPPAPAPAAETPGAARPPGAAARPAVASPQVPAEPSGRPSAIAAPPVRPKAKPATSRPVAPAATSPSAVQPPTPASPQPATAPLQGLL